MVENRPPPYNIISKSDLVATRTAGTIYQNLTGRLLWVKVTMRESANQSRQIIAYTEKVSPPTECVGRAPSILSTGGEVFFMVLPGEYYKVELSAGVAVLFQWIEWY